MTRLDNVKRMIEKVEALHKELFHKKPSPYHRYYFASAGGDGMTTLPKPIRSPRALEQHTAKFEKLRRLMKELHGKHGEFMKANGLQVDLN